MRRPIRFLLAVAMLCAVVRPATAQTQLTLTQYLNIRSAVSPSVSPDGSAVAYLSNDSGIQQVWLSANHQVRQLTHYTDRVSFVSFSPDGTQLIFGMDHKGNERTQLYLVRMSDEQITPLTNEPAAIHVFGGWSADGTRLAYASNERNDAFFDVYVMEVATAKKRRVLQENDTYQVSSWSPDGRSLVLRRDLTNLDNDLYLLDLVSGRKRLLTEHDGEALFGSVCWPAASQWLYVTTNTGRDTMGLARLDSSSGKLEFLVESQWDITDVAVSRSGRWLAWVTDEDGYARLQMAPSGDLEHPTVAELPPGVNQGMDFSADERTLAFSWSGPRDPADIWKLSTAAPGTPQRDTHSSLAGIPRDTFVEPTLVHYPTFDHRNIPAFLYAQPGWRGGPILLSIHGGPESQERINFSPLYQYFLHRGYAIMAPNIRGSMGYGKKYTHMDDVGKRIDAIQDVACAVQYLRDLHLQEAPRVAVFGGSYGGYMVLASLAFHPDLFAAGVDIVGIANLETFLRNTGAWRRKLRMAEYGDLDNDLETLRKLSPIHKVDAITAPLMVIQGAQDPRVPRSEADQMVNALRQRGKAVEYLLFEDEGHGIAHLSNRVKAYTAVDEFLEKYLK